MMSTETNSDQSVAAEAKSQRTMSGVVVSDKMDKNIVVKSERKVRHPLYGK